VDIARLFFDSAAIDERAGVLLAAELEGEADKATEMLELEWEDTTAVLDLPEKY
jgi:hypothetical protein